MSDHRALIDTLNAHFTKCFNSGDAAAVANCYSEHARLMPPGTNGKAFTGRAEIEQFWGGAIKSGLKNLALTTRHLEAAGTDLIIELGGYAHSAGTGSYVVIWKLHHANWMIANDIFN